MDSSIWLGILVRGRFIQRLLSIVLCALLTATFLFPTAALAWKPVTHVYLAQKAIADALDDGRVTIPRLNPKTGELNGIVGEYKVDSALLSALRSKQAQYKAGVLGPDAYPDILTGQQVIHPGPSDTKILGGTDAWLQHVWRQSQSGNNNTPEIRAFTTGFLTHAAGDMYAHTFINHFTGGPFEVTPPAGPQNAIKHIVLEGYFNKRTDSREMGGSFFNASIAGVEDFIYRTMIDARPGSKLDRRLLRPNGGGTSFSIPRIYSTLRANLQRDIDAYYRKKKGFDRRYDEKIRQGNDCKPLDFSCSRTALYAQAAVIQAEKGSYVAANSIPVTYKEAWRKDIDDGLKAWPGVSHKVATALFFNSTRSSDTTRAEDVLQDYVTRHLLSMSGAPDFVGLTARVVGSIIDAITPDFLLEPIRQLKEDLLNTLLKEAIGMNKQELEAYLKNPDRYFDQVMTAGAGERVTLSRFNRDYLKIRDNGFRNPSEAFDYEKVPAAYNTVMISKLILLPKEEVNRLLKDLGSRKRLSAPNIMLGFIQSLDADNEWHDNDSRMVLAGDYCAYAQVFMAQTGEKGTPSTSRCQR